MMNEFTYFQMVNKTVKTRKLLDKSNSKDYAGMTSDKLSVFIIIFKNEHFSGEKGRKYFTIIDAWANFGVNIDKTIKVKMEYER